jgi:hypothetical protein
MAAAGFSCKKSHAVRSAVVWSLTRKPQAWLKAPLTELDALRQRHDAVEAFLTDAQLRSDLRTLHLRGEAPHMATLLLPLVEGPDVQGLSTLNAHGQLGALVLLSPVCRGQ